MQKHEQCKKIIKNTPAWHRQRAGKLSAAARRPSKVGGDGGAHDLAAAARPALGFRRNGW